TAAGILHFFCHAQAHLLGFSPLNELQGGPLLFRESGDRPRPDGGVEGRGDTIYTCRDYRETDLILRNGQALIPSDISKHGVRINKDPFLPLRNQSGTLRPGHVSNTWRCVVVERIAVIARSLCKLLSTRKSLRLRIKPSTVGI